MTRSVVWSRDALDDPRRQVRHIARDNREAALHVAEALGKAAAQLGEVPTGRPGRVAGTYEKTTRRLPYIIVYALTERDGREIVAILHVIHTARNGPRGEWPA